MCSKLGIWHRVAIRCKSHRMNFKRSVLSGVFPPLISFSLSLWGHHFKPKQNKFKLRRQSVRPSPRPWPQQSPTARFHLTRSSFREEATRLQTGFSTWHKRNRNLQISHCTATKTYSQKGITGTAQSPCQRVRTGKVSGSAPRAIRIPPSKHSQDLGN